MSVSNYEEAITLMQANPKLYDFVGKRDLAVLEAAEQALGLKFPLLYHQFLSEFGAGAFGSQEIYGIISSDFTNSKVPDAVWLTLHLRTEMSLPTKYIVIGNDGGGFDYVLEGNSKTRMNSPVKLYRTSMPSHVNSGKIIADDFGEYFLNCVRKAIEIARLDDFAEYE